MTDIVERLRDCWLGEPVQSLVDEAADEITRLRAENERLRAALEPFAKAAACYDEGVRGSNMPRSGVWYGWKLGKGVEAELTVEHLRDARAALQQEPKP